VRHERSYVDILKGKEQVASLTSSESCKLTTTVTRMNAVGTYFPPLIIFPRKNMKEERMHDASAGCVSVCH
jgi:hypothetical protein